MPPGGAPARARAIGSIEGATHRLLTAPEIGELIGQLTDDATLDEAQRASVRVLGRDYALATKVPEELVRELGEVRGLAYQAWTEAREASEFSVLKPHLERLLDLKKQEADALGWEGERYDAMLDVYEPGTTTADIDGMFDELVKGLKPLVEACVPAGDAPAFLLQSYDTARQEAFCHWLVERLGFDTSQGRLDQSPHPFTMMVARGDVRQTTRTESTGVLQAVYATMHETGHALYEQGLPAPPRGRPAGGARGGACPRRAWAAPPPPAPWVIRSCRKGIAGDQPGRQL
jgi:carboxypeptidase Taq